MCHVRMEWVVLWNLAWEVEEDSDQTAVEEDQDAHTREEVEESLGFLGATSREMLRAGLVQELRYPEQARCDFVGPWWQRVSPEPKGIQEVVVCLDQQVSAQKSEGKPGRFLEIETVAQKTTSHLEARCLASLSLFVTTCYSQNSRPLRRRQYVEAEHPPTEVDLPAQLGVVVEKDLVE
jgi:hypothetical protein